MPLGIAVRSLLLIIEELVLTFSNSKALVVVYDYHPNSSTLAELHFRPPGSGPHVNLDTSTGHSHRNGKALSSRNAHGAPDRVSESTLWTYIFQIASAIKAVHEAGMAVRVVDPSKVIKTGHNR